MILTLIQATIFILYVTFLMVKFKGPLPSISDSWYALGYPLRILFSIFCISLGITMTQQPGSVFFFLSGTGLSFVGIATWFKSSEKIVHWIHFTGAVIGMVFALLGIGLGLENWYPLIMWGLLSLPIILFKIKNHMWWIEIIAFVAIIYGLLNI